MKKLLSIALLMIILLPSYAQRELTVTTPIHYIENMDADKCVKERDGKTPMALLHLSIPGIDSVYITEENDYIKGSPVKASDGWDIWVTTKTKNNIALKIYTDNYKPLQVNYPSKLESGKKYELNIRQPEMDVNAGKVYVFVKVNKPCEFSVRSSERTMKRIIFQSEKLDTLLHLPYGRYFYNAVSHSTIGETGSLILNGEPVEKFVELRSNRAKIRVWSDEGTTLTYDGQEQVAVNDTTVAGVKYPLYEIVDSIGSSHVLSASRENHTEKKDITVVEGMNNYDMHIIGTLEITKPKKASVTIDSMVTDESLPYKMPALGTYYVTYSQYGREPKREKYTVGIREHVKEGVSLKRVVNPFGFSNYTFSPSAEIGLMSGIAQRWGWYCSIKTSLQFWETIGNDVDSDDYSKVEAMKNPVMPEDWYKYNIDPTKLKKLRPIRTSVAVGAMKSLTWWLYVYLGVGYEHFRTLYENPNPKFYETRNITTKKTENGNEEPSTTTKTVYLDQYVSTYDLEGVCVDGGIMIRLGNSVNITAGWTHLFGSTMVGDFNVGFGMNIPYKK